MQLPEVVTDKELSVVSDRGCPLNTDGDRWLLRFCKEPFSAGRNCSTTQFTQASPPLKLAERRLLETAQCWNGLLDNEHTFCVPRTRPEMFVHRLSISLFIPILMSDDLAQTRSQRNNGVKKTGSSVEGFNCVFQSAGHWSSTANTGSSPSACQTG